MNEKNLIIAVFALLERENTVSIPQLARLLDAGEDEVWEALDALVFCYDAVSMRLDLHGSYASLEKSGSDRLLRLNEQETAILLDALEAQGFSPDDELCRKLRATKGFLEGASGVGGARPDVRLVNAGNVGGLMEQLAAACDDEERHLLEIEYQKEGASNAERRTVEPYRIVSEGDHRYLEAYCHKADGWRSFRTDRIRSVAVLDERFEPRAEVPQLQDERRRDPEVAHVRFAPGVPLPLWPGLAKSRENDDGSQDARVPWLGGLWLPKHIAGMLGDAVPLDPPRLVEATRSYADELLASVRQG